MMSEYGFCNDGEYKLENISMIVSGFLIGLILLLVPWIVVTRGSSFPKMLFKLYYTLEQNKKVIFLIMFSFSFTLGFMIYWIIYDLKFFQAVYYGLTQFMFDIKTPAELGLDPKIKISSIASEYYWIYLSAFVAALTSTLTIILLFFKEAIHKQYASYITHSKAHIIVCGLGKKAMAYIDSELKNEEFSKRIIVIEKNPNNPNIKRYLEKYYDREFVIKIADATDSLVLKKLNIENSQHLVLLAGKDTENIEIALAVSDVLKGCEKKIDYKNTYIHIEDSDLHKFYREGGLLDDSSLLHIKIFSMDKNSARSLFLEHDIDGENRKYIDSNRPFSIVVVGNSNLALEVISQACEIAHFPNENVMTIYCIDNNIAAFRRLIYYRYPNIDEIPTINLEFKKLNFQSRKFYTDSLWKNDVTNIILCHKDSQDNLDIVSELADSTYLENIKKNRMNTKIHIAIYENKQIAKNLNLNQLQFMYFDVFAETSKMAASEMIIDEKFEVIARCIHASYEEKYDLNREYADSYINHKWSESARLSDRDSNRSQAYHLPIKVKAMGLRIVSSEDKEEEYLVQNRNIINTTSITVERKQLGLDDTTLEEITKNYVDKKDEKCESNSQYSYQEVEKYFSYFPEDIDSILIEKLIRSEKNRWNAYHYLNGWTKAASKKKDLKEHDCLVPLMELPKDRKYTVLYDIYSILYIPNFLAKTEQKLKYFKPLKIGVTGHRIFTVEVQNKIEELLEIELKKLYEKYTFSEIISPLADGADRIVATHLMGKPYYAKLQVPLPYYKDDYEESFLGDTKIAKDKSKKEFNDLLEKAFLVEELQNIVKPCKKTGKEYVEYEEKINLAYLNMGQHIVDECDILIAIWDGKKAKGIGGTGEVVAYAKKKKRSILYINPDSLEIGYINFKGIS